MPTNSKRPNPSPDPSSGSTLARLAERPQVDFELDFYTLILNRVPDFADVLRAVSSDLTATGRLTDGLRVDQKLISLRPADPTAHYNLACRYALLKQRDLALVTLRKAVELGYRDFRYMTQDRDLESVKTDPRFRQLLREFGGRG